jgi:hypothetical protein
MLSDQKCSSDKSGLGFDKFPASSSHVASTSRTMIVKPEIFESHVTCLDKGKTVSLNDHVKVESKIHVKKQSKCKFIPTCYHCGIIGHTRPYFLLILYQIPWTKKNDLKKGKAGVEPSMPKNAPCKGDNLLKGLSQLAIIVAKWSYPIYMLQAEIPCA